MPTVLILSSHVAAGCVGGTAQALALAALRIDPVLIPTVLLGRTPGSGPAGGGVVEPAMFEDMIEGAVAGGLLGRVDVAITGHFSDPRQVAIAARTLDRIRTTRSRDRVLPVPLVIVDPILGDQPGGLYVKPEVAEAVKAELLTRADVLCPNLWELSWLTGLEAVNAPGVLAAARRLPAPALVTSAPAGPGRIGLVWAGAGEAVLMSHARCDEAPKGTGDLVTAILAAGLIQGLPPATAALQAARAAATAVAASQGRRALPIVALGDRLMSEQAAVEVERLG